MTRRISVTGNDASLADAVADWMEKARVPTPEPLRLRLLVADDVPSPDDDRPAFDQAGLHIVAGGPGRDLRLGWSGYPATAVLACDAREADVVLSPAAAADVDRLVHTFLLPVVILLLRRTGWHHVHAATGVDPRGRGWLLAGNANAGKSTTAALLASRGWQVGTDDVAFLADDGGRVTVHAPRMPIALRPAGASLLQARGGVPLHRRGKAGFFPEDLGGAWIPSVVPEILTFPVVGAEITRLEPLGPAATLSELVRWSSFVALEHDLAQSHLDLLAALGRQARAFRLHLGADLFDHPDLPADLVP